MSHKLLSTSRIGTALVGLALALAGCAQQDAPVAPAPLVVANAVGAAGIAGLNWADPRDNFVDDALVLSGLAAGDSYATVQTKADRIINGFQSATGANTVRLPINPTTATGTVGQGYKLVEYISVARVRPRTSKGITDLLLPQTSAA